MALINPIAIIKKWANGTNNINDVVIPPVTTDPLKANQEIGFPPSQDQDPTTGGTYVKRAEMNGVFKLYSEHIEFLNKGGNYTFNTDIATAAGYSTGATLWSDYYKRFVTSLKDNNTDNFITDINKIDGVSWGFSELSDYITVSEIPITGDLTTNGTEIVVYCGKKQFVNNGLYNVKIKFALKNSGGYGAMYSLSFMGNPSYKFQNAQYLLNNYTTNILLANNYTGATLEIKTYGGNLGTISEKPTDYVFIVLKIVAQPTGRTDWQNPFTLSDVCIEGLGTILPVIGKTLTETNTILGTNNISQNQEPRLLYFPSILDKTTGININNNNLINLNTSNFTINSMPITRTKKIIVESGYGIVGNLTAIKINFKQNPALNEIVYLIHCDFVVFDYPRNGYLYMPELGIDAGNIDFGGRTGANESFGSGSVVIDNVGTYVGLCAFRYSNQNIPEKNKITWESSATRGTGRFHITFYANSLNNNF
jgi:hypothetical protein